MCRGRTHLRRSGHGRSVTYSGKRSLLCDALLRRPRSLAEADGRGLGYRFCFLKYSTSRNLRLAARWLLYGPPRFLPLWLTTLYPPFTFRINLASFLRRNRPLEHIKELLWNHRALHALDRFDHLPQHLPDTVKDLARDPRIRVGQHSRSHDVSFARLRPMFVRVVRLWMGLMVRFPSGPLLRIQAFVRPMQPFVNQGARRVALVEADNCPQGPVLYLPLGCAECDKFLIRCRFEAACLHLLLCQHPRRIADGQGGVGVERRVNLADQVFRYPRRLFVGLTLRKRGVNLPDGFPCLGRLHKGLAVGLRLAFGHFLPRGLGSGEFGLPSSRFGGRRNGRNGGCGLFNRLNLPFAEVNFLRRRHFNFAPQLLFNGCDIQRRSLFANRGLGSLLSPFRNPCYDSACHARREQQTH